MSKYTTEVRFLCESLGGFKKSQGFDKVPLILTGTANKVFKDVIKNDEGEFVDNPLKYPIFDEHYRLPLETKILLHYYTREICEETVGLWQLRLLTRMREIMPYYNKLYESELLTFNPLYDVDMTRNTQGSKNEDGENQKTRNEEATGNSTSQGNAAGTVTDNGTAWDLYSDTPQGGINGIEGSGDVNAMNYLTSARKNTDNSTRISSENTTGEQETSSEVNETENGTHSITTTDEFLEHVTGKTAGASYSKLLMEFRETMLNIDKMIIDDLSDLFFGLWV